MKILKGIVVLLLALSCNLGVPDGVASPDKMIAILEDVHLVDAILVDKHIREGDEEALPYYEYIYEKHQITKEEFEHSINYYAKDPRELRKAYPKIVEKLAERDSLLKVAERTHIDTIQLWQGKKSYKVEKYTMNTLPVSIPVEYLKTYIISAEIKIYDDSQQREISPYFSFVAPDTTYVFPTNKITADSEFHQFKISKMVSDSTITQLKGDFFPAEKDSIEQFKHYEIQNISISTTSINTIDAPKELLPTDKR
ncbi:uncharacterized protein DUF4296 [Balneicella halophila]|uniref:Uncharacterized protein DUF4296 n=1 Tax=Balneicella halophila TaxID=1537566 RepID=A0A7L4UNZ3_BALHA|nr:DUF4296 domain-containing protein [Balneicella halophila]PVX50900.1 uncharacterized protein DUF4296 [Balneicella halophila]